MEFTNNLIGISIGISGACLIILAVALVYLVKMFKDKYEIDKARMVRDDAALRFSETLVEVLKDFNEEQSAVLSRLNEYAEVLELRVKELDTRKKWYDEKVNMQPPHVDELAIQVETQEETQALNQIADQMAIKNATDEAINAQEDLGDELDKKIEEELKQE